MAAIHATDHDLPPGARPATADADMLVYEWHDAVTHAVGWIAIEGDARMPPVGGGGLFVTTTTTESEVVDVAKSMARKLRVTCAAGAIRGAKGGIRYDPSAPDVDGVIGRFMSDNARVLREVWATGADLNTDHGTLNALAQTHVGIPHCLHALSVRYGDARPAWIQGIVGGPAGSMLRLGASEAAVGYGMARALRALTPADSLAGLRVAIQGFGAVGGTFAAYAQAMGATIVAVADRDRYVVDSRGIDAWSLLAQRQRVNPASALLRDCFGDDGVPNGVQATVTRLPIESDEVWLTRFLDACAAAGGIDVFSPCAQRYAMTITTMCALRRAIDARRRRRGDAGGTEAKAQRAYIASGANNISRHPDLLGAFLNAGDVWTVPDWVSNAGTACLFMEACTLAPPAEPTHEGALAAVGARIADFVGRAKALIADDALPTDLLAACHTIADRAVADRV